MSRLAKALQSAAGNDGSGASGGWDLANAVWNGPTAFSVAVQESNPNGVFFKPDGTAMYVVGAAGDDINQYTLSTAWDVTTASYVQNFSVNAQESTPTGVFFKPDGTAMYVVGTAGDNINQYTLSTAWDVATASYVQNFSVAAQEANPSGVFFKTDGTAMYVVGTTGDAVYQYTLSTAWDVTTASYVQNFSVAAQESLPNGVFFKPDGMEMYVVGSTGNDINQYTLGTAWDVTTASYVQNFSVSAQESFPNGVFFKTDGTAMYVVGSTGDDVYQYTLSTAWDIGTILSTQTFSVSLQESVPTGVFFKPDGTAMYVVGASSDNINQYTLSTAWDVTTASYVQNFSVTVQESSPTGVFFKPDGTAMYVVGSAGDAVYQYTLSTAWDVTTASYVQNFSISAQEASPTGVFFKPDGTAMYVVGSTGDDVYQYTLSTAWDVTTASYVQSFSVSAQESTPNGVFFKPDGTSMYVVGSSGDDINQYTLSTAWDVTTASYVQNFSVKAQETNPNGVFFKPDGMEMYVVGASGDAVYQYQL